MSSKSSIKSSESLSSLSLDFFQTQENSKCGIHALNNLYRNYDGPSFLKNILFTHGNCKKTRNLEIKRVIDVHDLCKKILEEQMASSKDKSKEEINIIKKAWGCSEQGSYRIETIERAVLQTGIDIIDHTVRLLELKYDKKKVNKDDAGKLFDELKEKAVQTRGLLGFLVQNTDFGGHYVAILPRNGGLVWVDSVDSHKKKNDKYTGFKYLTKGTFTKLVSKFTGLSELVDLNKTVLDSDDE
jgi:hypothetical protein